MLFPSLVAMDGIEVSLLRGCPSWATSLSKHLSNHHVVVCVGLHWIGAATADKRSVSASRDPSLLGHCVLAVGYTGLIPCLDSKETGIVYVVCRLWANIR